jgi:hypothetical protein
VQAEINITVGAFIGFAPSPRHAKGAIKKGNQIKGA